MEYEIKIDFYKDWTSHLRDVLEKAGYAPASDPEDVSIQYFNLLRRLVLAVPRTILIAKEFSCPTESQPGLDLVKEKIEQGIDLRPHLSGKLMNLDYDDDLLNDWDIYHLHLGTTLESDGFVNRTGPVLFVRFDQQNAYFINVMNHRPAPWSNQELLRIIHRNWPDSIKQFKAPFTSLNKPLTDKDIKAIRAAHSLYLIELEPGVVYMPPGLGLTTAGIGLEVVRASDRYADMMRTYEDVIKENIDELTDMIKAEGVESGKELSFRLKIEGKRVLAYEENHNVTVDLGELP